MNEINIFGEIMIKSKFVLSLLLIVGLLTPWAGDARASTDFQSQDQPVVRVVMFWLSTCGHCEYVINDVFPPLQEQYGEQLDILLIELVTQEDVDTLYETAALVGIPPNNVGVPLMLVGKEVLQGSQEIPNQLPGLIDAHLAEGGLDYPRFTTLESYLPDPVEAPSGTSSELEQPQSGTTSSEELSQAEPGKQPASNGFTIALVVLSLLWRKDWFIDRGSRVAVALLLSGIFGNLTDRLVQGFLLPDDAQRAIAAAEASDVLK